jgi:hypothetical protein
MGALQEKRANSMKVFSVLIRFVNKITCERSDKQSAVERCPQRTVLRAAAHKSAGDSGRYNDQFSNSVQESLSTNRMGMVFSHVCGVLGFLDVCAWWKKWRFAVLTWGR